MDYIIDHLKNYKTTVKMHCNNILDIIQVSCLLVYYLNLIISIILFLLLNILYKLLDAN